MVLILSENRDQSTSKVVEWLRFNKINFKRLNTGDPNPINSLMIENGKEIDIDFQTLDMAKITCIWYRRGYLSSQFMKNYGKFSNTYRIQQINSHTEMENKRFFDFLYNNLNKNSINNPIDNGS